MKGNGDYDETDKRTNEGCMCLYYQPDFDSSIFWRNFSLDAVYLKNISTLKMNFTFT